VNHESQVSRSPENREHSPWSSRQRWLELNKSGNGLPEKSERTLSGLVCWFSWEDPPVLFLLQIIVGIVSSVLPLLNCDE
jgi:hypothetical protein